MKRAILAVMLTLSVAPVVAATPHKSAPAALDPAQAYVLVRLGERAPKSWNTLGLSRYDSAAQDLAGRGRAKAQPLPARSDRDVSIGNRALIEDGHVRTYLVAVTPGRYVLSRSASTCFCLGSFAFDAAAGRITDLGSIYIGAENGSSPWGALSHLHSPVDVETLGYAVSDAMAVVPVTTRTPVPTVLAGLPRVPAVYVAAPRFGNHDGLLLNRVLPMGVSR